MPPRNPAARVRSPARRARSVALLLPLAGCGTLPPPAEAPVAVEVPARWSAGAGADAVSASSLQAWWQRFGDATLAAWVERALQHGTRVAGAQGALRQAQAQRKAAAAALSPTLDASASARRNVADNGSGQVFQAGLGLNWAPDVFGAGRAALAAAAAAERSSAATLGDVQVQVAAEVALAYLELRAAQARLVLAADNLASQQETLQITDWRQQAGLVSTLELEQARAAAAQTQALLPALRTRAAQARHALGALAGLPPAPEDALEAGAGIIPAVTAPEDLALAIPAETLRQRADVRAAEHAVAAARGRLGQAEAQRWPGFALGGTVGLNALTLGALGDRAALLGSLLASVSVPLFDGGARRAQVRVQQAALEQAQQAWRAAVLAALQQVEDALAAVRGARQRLQSLRVAATAASAAATLARQRFSSGLVDFQTVLDTQRTQLGAQDALALAGAELGSAHVNLFKALGGGWREAPPPAGAGTTP